MTERKVLIMAHIYEGTLVSEGLKYGIVVARFNEFITSKLLTGSLDALKRHGVAEEEIHVAWVPGAFEIPFVAQKMAESGKYDAVITLGTVEFEHQTLRGLRHLTYSVGLGLLGEPSDQHQSLTLLQVEALSRESV